MSIVIEKIKASKIVNTGIIKKVKDLIYFKVISPRKEGETDKYRKEIMDIIFEVFENKKWILSSGSFLRFYRDKTMKKQDLDILIDEQDFNSIKDKLIEKGFMIKACYYNKNEEITEYKYDYKNVEVDIFMVRQDEEGKTYHTFTMEGKGNKLNITKKVKDNYIIVTGKDYKSWKRYTSDFDKIKIYEYDGFKFYGPKYAEKFLEELYGENWNIYDPNFDPRYAPKKNMAIMTEYAKAIIYMEGQKEEIEVEE